MKNSTEVALNNYLELYYRLGRLQAGLDSATYDDSQALLASYRASQIAWCAAQSTDDGITFDMYMARKNPVISRIVAEVRAMEAR